MADNIAVEDIDSSILSGRVALIEVLKATQSITDWSNLSLLMGLESYQFTMIERNSRNPQMEIIQTWFDRGEASWASLATYLCDPLVNKVILAKEIEANHRKGDQKLTELQESFKSMIFEQSPAYEHMESMLKDYATEYDRIGMILGLDYQTRRTIDTQYLSSQKKLNAMIHKSLQSKPDTTWKSFIAALRKDEMNKLANDIEEFLKSKEIQEFYVAKKK